MTERNSPFMLLSRRGFLATSSAALATIALPMSARAQNAGVLRYALSAYPTGLDPFRREGQAATSVKLQVYRGLLTIDGDANIIGALAESFEAEGDRSYVFHLRENALFHNGEPVRASDVAWTLEQMTKEGSTAYLQHEMSWISTVDVVDDHTVKITLTEPSPIFLKLLATSYVPILSEKAGLETPTGAGPYRITNAEQGVAIDLEAFEGYYKEGHPRTPRLRMIAYADESLRVAALESGDVDIIEYVPWQNMASVENNPNLDLLETRGPFMAIVFNVERPPFNDPRVRQAVAYAIRREDIVNTAFYGRGSSLYGLPLDETDEFASETTKNLWSYDPDKARSLLEEAGVAGQTVRLLSSATYSMHQDTALVVQQHLNAVGLQVELQLPEWGARISQGNAGEYQFAINGNASNVADPDGLTPIIGSGSPTYQRSWGYSNSRIDELLAQGRKEIDPAKRREIYNALAEVVKEDVPICTLTWRSQGFGLRSNVQEFQALDGVNNGLSPVFLENTALV